MKKLYSHIAEKIENRILNDPSVSLPSIAELAIEFGATAKTVARAVHLLADKGLIECHPGRKISIAGKSIHPESDKAIERIFGELRERIIQGTYRKQSLLPKVALLAQEFHVSPNSLQIVLNNLAKENYVHKKGKFWRAGPSSAESELHDSISYSSQADTVAVAVPAQRSWHYLFAHKPLNDFALPFHAEVLEHKLNISVVFLENEPSPKSPLTMASGENDIISYIDSIKSRFRGMLIACDPAETRGLGTLIPKACRFKRPVVLFDVADTGKSLTREIGSAAQYYYRAHFNETGATEIAARALTEAGHRRIAIPFIEDRPHPWMQRRIKKLTDSIHTCDPSAEVTARKLTHSFWSTTDWRDIHHFVSMIQEYEANAIKKRAKQVIRKGSILKRAREYGHELISLLEKTRATAIVAPNDTIARELYFFCDYVGIKIPQDISLISFDNNPIASLFPLCTIDPGLAQLGYVAAHTIIGDFKVKADVNRGIASKCRLINRGSLGRLKAGG